MEKFTRKRKSPVRKRPEPAQPPLTKSAKSAKTRRRSPASTSSSPQPGKSRQPSSAGPLAGETFVITGELSHYSRQELTEKLKGLGARVTGSVSSRTTCLIYGPVLETGKPYTEGAKYKKAAQLKTRTMNEQELEEFLSQFVEAPATPHTPPLTRNTMASVEPWTEKYKPRSIKEIIGNAPALEKLSRWLREWEDVVLRGKKKELKFSKGRFDPQQNLNARAALLSGSPGIGKTTAARLIAAEEGYQLTELNASDVRSRKVVLDSLIGASLSHSLTVTGKVMKTLIIMDEVDGMSAGDRGGVSAIIQLIKKATVPIICICNDRQNKKLKSLVNHCYDVRFNKPNKAQVTRRLMHIVAGEGLEVQPNALEAIIEASGNDIRQCLHTLELWARSHSALNYADARQSMSSSGKDKVPMLNAFEAAGKLLNSREELSHRQKLDLFFLDYDLIPLLVYENYLAAVSKDPMRAAMLAADSISFGDLLQKQVRVDGAWLLLPSVGQASCIEPGQRTGGGVPFARFPEWFGRYSTQRRKQRLLAEVKAVMPGYSNEDLIDQVIPVLYKLILRLLVDHGSDGIDEALGVLHSHGLTLDMLKEHLIELQTNPEEATKLFKAIPTKVRSALTRAYNKKFANTLKKKKAQADSDDSEQDQPDEEALLAGLN